MIYETVKNFMTNMPKVNPMGESVTLVAAVKTQTPEAINEAISAGITDIGDNHVQEFRDKYDLIQGEPRRHFIGHLQLNKIKYLLGKTFLYQSADRDELTAELSARSLRAGVTSDVLLQINAGSEISKGGYSFDEIYSAFKRTRALPNIRVRGIMAMLPLSDDAELLTSFAKRVRAVYDDVRSDSGDVEYLSMGMSGDYRLCIECGSNMIRIGTSLFGARNYN